LSGFNPFRCSTESARRLSISLYGVALLSWFTWVGIASNGFSQVKPIGWLILFGAPIVVYLALLPAVALLPRASKEIRLLLSASFMWIFSIVVWGYIWDWERTFTIDKYLALLFLPTVGVWIGYLLWKWSKEG